MCRPEFSTLYNKMCMDVVFQEDEIAGQYLGCGTCRHRNGQPSSRVPMPGTRTTLSVSDNQTPASSACSIVLVDDDFASRWALRGVLKRLGFLLAAEASNGEEAVLAVARTKPDIVLLDVCMPLRSGPDALSAIFAAHAGAKVVMLTSMADEATVVDCIEKGAVDYVRKDTPLEEICRVLSELRENIAAERA
jgi:two-component system, chemotaxis family, chemotaxis protein CheY